MKIFLSFLTTLTLIFTDPTGSLTDVNSRISMYSNNKFFVKTKVELSVSEATGKIMIPTGIKSIDDKILKYNITEIKTLFKLNNGDPELYKKLGMPRIYVFYTEAEKQSGYAMEEIVKDFNRDITVEYGEPDYIGISAGVKESAMSNLFKKDIVPDDEMFYKQWYLQNTGSVNPSGGGRAKIGADIKILNAWDIEKGSDEVIVAILDSGIKDDHPDFAGRIWINKDEIPGNDIDDDRNGYTDDTRGWDFAYDDKRPDDGFGHGTNIATVIGAKTNNNLGFAGIDMKCKLMNCKNLNSNNSGEYSWWAESIKYAVDNGANIINMSEGGDDYSKVLKTAIEYALESDVLVIASMMNKGDGRDYFPASYKGVFAVGATDTDDSRCKKFSWGGGSCWGKHISVVAPGNRIYGLDYENENNYEVYWSGTSQSTAIVSGIASLLKAQNKYRSSEEIKKIIMLTSKDLVGDIYEDRPGWDKYHGFGRVDSYAALIYEYTEPKDQLIEDKNLQEENNENQESGISEEDKQQEEKEEKPAKAVDRDVSKDTDRDNPGPAKSK